MEPARERANTGWSALEAVPQRREVAAVILGEAELVDTEHLAGEVAYFRRNGDVLHFRIVTHAFEERVRDSWSRAAAARDAINDCVIHRKTEHASGTLDDALQVILGIEIELVHAAAEARAEWGRELRYTGGGAHEGERRKCELDGACRRALPEDDIERTGLKRRVQKLFNLVGELVNLINEEDGARFEIREDSSKVACALYRDSGRRLDRGFKGVGDEVGERGLADAWRAIEKEVFGHVATVLGRGEHHLHVRFHVPLAYVFIP